MALAGEWSFLSAEKVGSISSNQASWYMIARFDDGKKKLYVEGDMFCSDKYLNNCLRIKEIRKDSVLLEDVGSKKTFILEPGTRVPLKDTVIIFEKAVQSDVVEYNYKTAEKPTREQLEDFTVKNLSKKKIVLERPYKAETLKAALFDKIETQKLEENVYAVDKKSARSAMKNAGLTLLSVIKNIKPEYRFGKGPSLRFDSELGAAVLNNQGFLVQDLLDKSLMEKTGIKEGDLIRSVNGEPVNSLIGLYRLYQQITSDDGMKSVSIDIVRDGKQKILVYKIK